MFLAGWPGADLGIRPGDRMRSCVGGSSSQPSLPACSCPLQQSISAQQWDTLARSLTLQQEILPKVCREAARAGLQVLPRALLPAHSLLPKPHQGWLEGLSVVLVGNLMHPFRSGQELGSPTHPKLPARCDVETLPGILLASAGHRVPVVFTLCSPIVQMFPSPFPSCFE